MNQPPDWVWRMLAVILEAFVILTLWAVTQKPMTDYDPLVTFVVAFQLSIVMLSGVFAFMMPTVRRCVRNYVENILMEEYE